MKTHRYLAELAKFRIAAPSAVLLRLKQLLDDFNGNNIDAACALVENAGRFFIRLPGGSRASVVSALPVLCPLCLQPVLLFVWPECAAQTHKYTFCVKHAKHAQSQKCAWRIFWLS